MDRYTEQELAFIINKKELTGWTWQKITDKYNKKFRKNKDFEAIKKCYQRNKHLFRHEDYEIKILKDIHRTKKANSYRVKENRTVLSHLVQRDDLIDQFKDLLAKTNLKKYKPPKSLVFKGLKKKKKDKMTLELLFGDVHYGKYVVDEKGDPKIHLGVIQKRIKKLCSQVIKEIAKNAVFYDVERLVIGMLGDIIESSTMHGEESLKGCEFGTSRQMNEGITDIFFNLLLPLSQTGLPKIDVVCVPGNHDRTESKQTYVRPGENNLTYVIYKQLELLCNVSGLKNINFKITSKFYTNYEIYGNTVVIEHGSELKNLNRQTMMQMMNKRQNQILEMVDFYRVGHWHERVDYGQGKIQVNASVCGQDDYSEGKGFDSEALQILNYYIKTNKRRTCFFRSFPIYLEEK